MPEIRRFSSFKLLMFFQDENPPHVHIKGADFAAKIRISNGDLLAGQAPNKVLKQAVAGSKRITRSCWRCGTNSKGDQHDRQLDQADKGASGRAPRAARSVRWRPAGFRTRYDRADSAQRTFCATDGRCRDLRQGCDRGRWPWGGLACPNEMGAFG